MAKKSVLALSVSLAVFMISGAVNASEIYNKAGNKLDFYGKAVGEHKFTTTGHTSNNDSSYARIGFRGETQINDSLTGFGQWEYNLDASAPEDGPQVTKTRLAFAGIKAGEFGSFDYGRNYGAIYDVESFTDILVGWGGDTWNNADNFMTGRTNGVATYRNQDLFGLVDGLAFAIQYQGKNDGGSHDHLKGNGDGVSLSTTYAFGSGFSVAAGYASSNRTSVQKKDNEGQKAEAWAVAAKYDANSIYTAVMYSETHNLTPLAATKDASGNSVPEGFANKTQNFEMVAQYQFDFGLRPSLAYVQSKGKNLGSNHTSADLKKYIELGTWYYFNKNMNVYGAHQFNLLDEDSAYAGTGTDNLAVVGITYQF
ncbi:porin [Citrobacter portucalensis]|uniref:porin n=1 Tax=Citrobacter portucalensis TaxID=1639133 RepID=UPI00226B10D2|nr:porin [Citrobacter portucalensis]MCX8985537.1 porin [Citrobacter portucalensis]